jgi:hypothetical protein
MYIYVMPGKHFIFMLLEMHTLGLRVELSGIVYDFMCKGKGSIPDPQNRPINE